jgi:hypothetical protein
MCVEELLDAASVHGGETATIVARRYGNGYAARSSGDNNVFSRVMSLEKRRKL